MPKNAVKAVLQIFKHLEQEGKTSQVTLADLRKIITLYGGISKLTVDSYLEFMRQWDLIKATAPGIVEIQIAGLEQLRAFQK